MTDDVSDIDHIIDRIRAAHDAGTTLDEISARLAPLISEDASILASPPNPPSGTIPFWCQT